jgi:monoamine oxidase
MTPSSERPREVAVIGAGLAGLTAATRLRAGGVDPVVFEARDRVGGRACTQREGVAGDQHLELGGEIVDRTYGAFRTLCGEVDVELTSGTTFLRSPQCTTPLDGFLAAKRFLLGDRLLDESDAAALRGELATALAAAPADPSETLTQWGRRARVSPELEAVIAAFARVNPMRDPWAADPLYAFTDGWGRSFQRVRRGTGALPERLAAGLDVRLGQRVTRIAQERGRCAVRTTDGVTSVDHVIVAVPLRVVPEMGFDPPLSAGRLDAMLAQGFALGGKVVAQYAEAEALTAVLPGTCLTDGPISGVWLSVPPDTGGRAVVAGFAAGAHRRILDDEEAALEALDRIVSALLGRPARRLAGRAKHWTADRYARAVGSPPSVVHAEAVPVMSAPHGRVAFAGDYAELPFFGTLEGAVRSGIRAADEVLDWPRRVLAEAADALAEEAVA